MKTLYPTINVELDDGAYLPTRAHDVDAGADLRTPYSFTVPAHGWALVDTGVHVELPHGTCGLIVSKSGLNVKHDITTTGLIDEGYSGSIKAKLYNHGDTSFDFNTGEKITQLVVLPVCFPNFVHVDSVVDGERGSNGFGSTGR